MRRGTAPALTLAAALLPGAALAHASDRAVLLTLPTRGFILGAGAAVALTALATALRHRAPAFPARALYDRPRLLPGGLASWLAAGLTVALILIGLLGSRDPYANLLPLTLWVLIWVGLTLLQALFGDLWRAINPWSGPVRSLRQMLGRTAGVGLSRLGHWPAVAGFLAFAWFEIVSLSPDDPARLAVIVGLYWLAIFALATAEGEDWLARGEFMTLFLSLVARIAPLWSRPGRAAGRITRMIGLPGSQIADLPPLTPSGIAFVTLAIASVSFDGLHETFRWLALIGLNPLDYPGRSAVVGVNSAGLLATWGLMTALILGAVRLALALAGQGGRFAALIGPFALSFLPIAAGYHIAHYLTALLTQGQYAVAALSDPLARGDDLLGLGPHWISFGFLTDPASVWRLWLAAFAVILGAHLVAVLVAAAVARRAGLRLSVLAELPLTALMVLYTCFGLWLLAAPAIG